MKRSPFLSFLLSASLLLAASPFTLAAILPEDLKTIRTVERIQGVGDDSKALEETLAPLMEEIARELKDKPNDYRLHFAMARAYERMGMDEMAADEDKAAEASGKDFGAFAVAALKRKVMASEWDSAMTYYPFAAKYFPDDASVGIVKAIQLGKHGELAQEEKILQAVLESGQKELGVLSVLASLKAEKGHYREALPLFDRDLALAPNYEPALLGKATVLAKLGYYKQSLAISVPLYLVNPYRRGLAGLVADSFSQIGQYKNALRPAAVSLAVAAAPAEMDTAKRRIALIWPRVAAKERELEIAGVSSYIDSAVSWGARMHFALGDALLKAGFAPEAEIEFRHGLKLQARHGRAYFHLGEIYQNYYHDNRTAFIFYLKYLSLSDDPLVKSRLARLAAEAVRKNDIALRLKHYVNGVK
jgi:tetratricopeptide (TPR) repeat protein